MQTVTTKRKSRTEEVQDALMEMILNHRFAEDGCLPSEQAISEMFGVSRTTTRSAVGALVEKGLLERKHGKGIYVANNSVSVTEEALRLLMLRENYTVAELLETRKILEPQTAYYAALRASEEEIARLKEYVDRMHDFGREYNEEFTTQDFKFHIGVAYASKNKMLIAFLEAIKPFLLQIIQYVVVTGGQVEADCRIHREVYDAIAARDPELARERMHHNMETSEATLLKSVSGGASVQELVR